MPKHGKPPRISRPPTLEIESDTDSNEIPLIVHESPLRPPPLPSSPRTRKSTPPPPPPHVRSPSPAPLAGIRLPPSPPPQRSSSPAIPAPAATSPSPKAATSVESAWQNELDVLRREVESLRASDPDRAALHLGALAEVAGSALGDGVGRAAALAEASGLSNERWVPLLARRDAMVSGNWNLAIELLRRELPLTGDLRERVALLLEMATIEEFSLGDLPAARKSLMAAREIEPASLATLEALGEIHLATSEWRPLVGVLAAQAEATCDLAFRSMLHHAAGLFEELLLDDPNAARALYRLALVDDPQNLPATISLQSLALRQEDWGELATMLIAEARLVEEPRTVARVCERAGDLYWERLANVDSAADAYRRAAHALPETAAPLRKLAAVLESSGKWRELIDVHVAELPLATNSAWRAELHHRIGEIRESHLGHLEEAIIAYRAALEELPTHAPTLHALSALYRRTEKFGELVQMHLKEVERIVDPQRRASRYHELGELTATHLSDPKEAVRLHERSLELMPGHRGAFAALETLYRTEGRFGDLVTLYERQALAVSDPQLVRLYRQEIGRLYAERLDQPDRAAKALRAALEIDAPDLAPLVALARVLEETHKWEPLVELLERLTARLTDTPDIVATLHRLGRVLEGPLMQEGKALSVHLRVLERDPHNEVSLQAQGRLHHRAGRWAPLVASVEQLLPSCGTPEERAALHYRMGRIYERRLGQRDQALSSYETALEKAPSYTPAQRALERLLRRDRLWTRLVEMYERRVLTTEATEERAEAQAAIGQIEELHRRDLERAERAYAAAIQEEPRSDAALAGLSHVREARGDFAGLEEIYTSQQAQVLDPAARVALLARLGALYEFRLRQPARALQAYQTAFETSPLGHSLLVALLRAARLHSDPSEATTALQLLGGRTGDAQLAHGYRALAALRLEITGAESEPSAFFEAAALDQRDPLVQDGVLRALAKRMSDPTSAEKLPPTLCDRARTCQTSAAQGLLCFEAACLFDRAGRAREAALAYEEADRALPNFLPVVRGVRRIAAANEQWSAVTTLLQHEAEVAVDLENRATALLAAGEIAFTRLGDPQSALIYYQRLLQIQPLHERAFNRAVALLDKLNEPAGLLEIYRARTSATSEPKARAALLRQQAMVQRDLLADLQGAIASLKEATSLVPTDLEGLLLLAPLQEKQRWWQDAVMSYRQISELAAGNDASRSARLKEAEILERELGDREGARQLLEELVVDVEDREAGRAMAGLCERMGRWDRAREVWSQLARTDDPKERVDALLALANILSIGLADEHSAAKSYDEALAIAQGDPEIARIIEQRFIASGDWQTFAASAERVCERARVIASPEVPLRLALARAYLEELHRPDLAEAHLKTCVTLAPDDPAPYLCLGRLHLQAGRVELAMPQFRHALDLQPFNAELLRGVGGVFLREGIPDAARMLDEVAQFAEGGAPAARPLGPLMVKQPLGADERLSHFPRAGSQPVLAMGEIARLLEPYAPGLLIEATGRKPSGELVTDSTAIAGRVRAVALALGLEAPRLFMSGKPGSEIALVADDRLALSIGEALAQPQSEGRFTFEAARLLSWVADGATIGAYLQGRALTLFLQALTQEGGDEEVKDLRRRVSRPVPRRLRKELERIAAEQIGQLGRDSAAWYVEEQRFADRMALLISRNPTAAFEAFGARRSVRELSANPRAVELVRWMSSEACWRTYLRLGAI